MKYQVSVPTRGRRLDARAAARVVAVVLALAGAYALPRAQAPAPAAPTHALTVEDYTKWRTITGQEISGDGNWAAYVLSLTNLVQADSKPGRHLVAIQSGQQTGR